MRRLLVGFDGSTGARRAALLCAHWAKQLGAELLLAYVVPPSPKVEDAPAAHALEHGLRGYGEHLLELGARMVEDEGAEVTCLLLEGDAAEALARAAETYAPEWLAVGGGDRSLVSRAMLGSVTRKLMQLTSRPVLCCSR